MQAESAGTKLSKSRGSTIKTQFKGAENLMPHWSAPLIFKEVQKNLLPKQITERCLMGLLIKTAHSPVIRTPCYLIGMNVVAIYVRPVRLKTLYETYQFIILTTWLYTQNHCIPEGGDVSSDVAPPSVPATTTNISLFLESDQLGSDCPKNLENLYYSTLKLFLKKGIVSPEETPNSGHVMYMFLGWPCRGCPA